MKLVEHEQNTPDWLKWRASGFSASEAPAVMGEGHFFPRTPYELYLVHTGQKQVFYNQAMKDGHALEETALQKAREYHGLDFQSACAESGPYLASFDGYCRDTGRVVEVKVTTFDSHLWRHAESMYKWQLVHQALVADIDSVTLLVYAKDTKSFSIKEVAVSEEEKAQLKEGWARFDDAMTNFEGGSLLSDKDIVTNDSPEFAAIAARFKEAVEQKNALEAQIKQLKEQMLIIADGRHMKGAGVSIFQVNRKGAIDYKAIDALKDVDLEKYRKPATAYWVVK